MIAKINAIVLGAMKVVVISAVCLNFILLIVSIPILTTIPNTPIVAVLVVIVFTIFNLLWLSSLSPRRCQWLGCNGLMRRTWVEERSFKWRLQYICTICGDVYDTNFTFEFGGPMD